MMTRFAAPTLSAWCASAAHALLRPARTAWALARAAAK